MMCANEAISIIVPYYNESSSIQETLYSLYSQTYAPAEIVLVNSMSTDNSAVIVEDWIERNKNQTKIFFLNVTPGSCTPASSKNAGVSIASSELLAFMDCGQEFTNTWLADQYSLLRLHGVDAVLGAIKLTGVNWVDRCAVAQTYGYRRLRYCVPGTLIRKSAFFESGQFIEGKRAGYDAVWLRSIKNGKFRLFYPQSPCINYRGTNFSQTLKELFVKSLTYARPTIGLPGYIAPIIWAILSLMVVLTIILLPRVLLFILILYVFLRGILIPLLKAKSIGFFREHSVTVSVGGSLVVAILIDIGRTIGIWFGIVDQTFKQFKKLK